MSSQFKLTSFRQEMLALSLLCVGFSAYASVQKIFLQATQKIPNFGGITLRPDGKLLVCGYNKNVRLFNPLNGDFEGSVFVLPQENFSFPNASTIIPADPTRDIIGGFACSSFIDGRIWTVLNDGTVIESNIDQFETASITGPVNVFTFNPTLAFDPEYNINGIQGAQPIYYRKSNDRLYTQSGFDNTQLFSLDWRGSVPQSVVLSSPATLNSGQFGALDDMLYAPDFANNRIVKIDVDTGLVTTVTTGIPNPIALKIDHNGILYFISRSTGSVYSYNVATDVLTVLATLEPALTDCELSLDQSRLYVTNDQSTIYQVTLKNGNVRELFSSPIVGPWDNAFDPSSKTLYVADNGSLKEFETNGKLYRKLTLDSSANPLYNGFGLVCGVSVDDTTIVITDVTLGNMLVLNKSDFSLHDYFNTFDPVNGEFIFSQQPFSAVRVLGGPVGEYYLIVNPISGQIAKLFPTASGLAPQVFFSGLNAPVKLKIYNDYVYVVEAGDVFNETPNTGRVSRIPLVDNPTPEDLEPLVLKLNQPEGFDIFDDVMYILETANSRIVSASAVALSIPVVVQDDLNIEDEYLLYQFAPIRIHPFTGLAVNPDASPKKIKIYSNNTELYQIIEIKVKL